MKIVESSINDCYRMIHEVHRDSRGFFREWFKSDDLSKIVPDFSVIQGNFSHSKRNVIRGIHYSIAPAGQSKVVTCAFGEIVDVLVDLRIGSPTFLQIEYVTLSDDSADVVFVASGVGHGFVVKSEVASVVYLTSSEYSPEFEKSICPTDSELDINWNIAVNEYGTISKADTMAPTLSQARELGHLPLFNGL